MSKPKLWSQAAASLEKACEDEPLATKWKESLVNLCKKQQDECKIEKLPASDAARLILHSLGRGHALIKQADEWKNPVIGASKNPSRLNLTRGIMWRYVMAYCGWEQCTKSLGLTQKTQDSILTTNNRLKTPVLSKSQVKQLKIWLPSENKVADTFIGTPDDKLLIQDFLNLSDYYSDFPCWLLSSKKDINLTDAAVLAILRNICVHGSLSPTKARNWGLESVYQDGTTFIVEGFETFVNRLMPK